MFKTLDTTIKKLAIILLILATLLLLALKFFQSDATIIHSYKASVTSPSYKLRMPIDAVIGYMPIEEYAWVSEGTELVVTDNILAQLQCEKLIKAADYQKNNEFYHYYRHIYIDDERKWLEEHRADFQDPYIYRDFLETNKKALEQEIFDDEQSKVDNKQMQAQRDIACGKRDASSLYAPMSGYVAAYHVQNGQKITPETDILTFLSEEMEITAYFDSKDYNKIKIGQFATIHPKADTSFTFKGRVSSISNDLEPLTNDNAPQLFKATIIFNGYDYIRPLRAGVEVITIIDSKQEIKPMSIEPQEEHYNEEYNDEYYQEPSDENYNGGEEDGIIQE